MSENKINIEITIDMDTYYKFIEDWVENLETNGVIFKEGDFTSCRLAEICENTPMDPVFLSDKDELIELCFGDISEDDAIWISRCWKYFLGGLIADNSSKKSNKSQ